MLQRAATESLEGFRSKQAEDLKLFIAGKRLRDRADMPLDLAIGNPASVQFHQTAARGPWRIRLPSAQS